MKKCDPKKLSDQIDYEQGILSGVFEERAENLSKKDLLEWTAETPRDTTIIRKLKGPGAKLLSGPRGSGKSTLLRKALYGLLDDGQVLTAYVNYSRSLALEPLFHRQANALQIFRQWVLYKIVRGIYRTVSKDNSRVPESLYKYAQIAEAYISDLATGKTTEPPSQLIAPSDLVLLLERWAADLGFRRCVLLLDDAAHAFSPEQQREFFEVFRNLRSRHVAAKAAVYPGITSYSPYFHVGHEAELLEAWYRPDENNYLQTMRKVAKARLPSAMYKHFENKEEFIDYLALASFGLPRGFLNMLSQTLGVEEDLDARPTRRSLEQAVSTHAESVLNIFRALRRQLPRLKHFIDVGMELERAMALTLRDYNKSKSAGRQKGVVVGIAEPIGTELRRILAMAEYAGVVRKHQTVSRGVKGVFHRYALHSAIILSENSLSLGKSYPLTAAIQSLKEVDAHAFTRSLPTSLLGPEFEKRCTIDLEPCQKCGAQRLSEEARFCMRCGYPLKDVSVYEELINSLVENLPLTSKKIEGLLKYTSIRTIQDILLDEESEEIRKVPYVGPIWTARIQNAAKEYVSV